MRHPEDSLRQVRNRGSSPCKHRQRLTAQKFVESLEARRLFAILTVNTAADSDVRDAFLTLREAIEVINGSVAYSALSASEQAQVNLITPLGSGDEIDFNIPGSGVQTISPTTNLPEINNKVIIDGYTQPGSARASDTSPAIDLIRLDGASDTDGGGVGLESDATETHLIGLVIDNFSDAGILLQDGSTFNVLEGDYIGVTPDGLFAEGNGIGVDLDGSTGSLIGAGGASDRNIISGNGVGIIFGGGDDGTKVTGNYIGVDANGGGQVGNDGDGIEFFDAGNITVGGTSSSERNIISGNGGDGIKFDATTGKNNVQGDVVEGNYIGTDATGMIAAANVGNGIEISGGTTGLSPVTMVAIGGTAAGAGNVISGNSQDGIFIHNGGAENNTVQGNLLGINAAGTGILPNFDGVFIQDADSNTIGGTVAAAGNLIGGNTQDGVDIDTGNQNIVQANRIGVLADGVTAAGNQVDGVSIEYAADQNVIGGLSTDSGNLIANNGRNGVELSSLNGATPTQNTIRLNSIYGNARLGIDLDVAGDISGVTPNDAGDGDTGSNDYQNFPLITSAITTGSAVTVSGQFNSTANAAFVLDFYANAAANATGNGEGKQYIGSINVTTDANGNASYSGTLNAAIGSNAYISATASTVVGAGYGDTSEFAQTLMAVTPTPPPPTSPIPASYVPRLQTLKTTLQSLQATFHTIAGNKQQIAAIKKMLSATAHQLNQATALVKKQTMFAAHYNKEVGLITMLQAQLAAQTAPKAIAKIQKKINTDTAAETKFVNQDNAVSTSALAALNAVSADETSIQSQLSGL